MYGIGFYIEPYHGIGCTVIRGLYHPFEAADIHDYFIMYAFECDGCHRAAKHSFFRSHYIDILGTHDYIHALVLFKTGVETFEFVPRKFRHVIGGHCAGSL